VHEAIRAGPVTEKKARSKPAEAKNWQPVKLTYEQRKEALKARLNTLMEADDE
jgi:large subunit ribosomal protein L5e